LLSYHEKRELQDLPAVIEKLEARQDKIMERMSQPEFFRQNRQAVDQVRAQLDAVKDELLAAYQLWEYLENPIPGASSERNRQR